MNPLEHRTKDPDYITRPYEKKDRDRIRQICCETGFLGEPIDAVFGDRDLFCDYLTRYYTDMEPESCWVGEKNGEVVGYLIACGRWRLNHWWGMWNNVRMAFKVSWRFLTGQYDAKTRKFLWWSMTRGWRETPPAPANSGHFHFNSLKGHRKMGIARDLMVNMLGEFRKRGVPRVYGQMVTYDRRRTQRVFEYIGLKVTSQKRITKYQDTVDKEMYLTTVVKELNDTEQEMKVES